MNGLMETPTEGKESDQHAMYILVNEDIKIGKGKIAGQVGHAVSTYIYRFVIQKGIESRVFSSYMEKEQIKIILKCSEEKLLELEMAGYTTIRDKGYTQLPPNTLTCVNLGIMRKSSAPEWVKKLKLYH